MKRVKIMLVAITMIAAVGGALAFKAAKVPAQKAFTCSPDFTCQVLPLNNVTTTSNPNAFTIRTSYTLTIANVDGQPCDNEQAPCTIPPSTLITAEN